MSPPLGLSYSFSQLLRDSAANNSQLSLSQDLPLAQESHLMESHAPSPHPTTVSMPGTFASIRDNTEGPFQLHEDLVQFTNQHRVPNVNNSTKSCLCWIIPFSSTVSLTNLLYPALCVLGASPLHPPGSLAFWLLAEKMGITKQVF